MLLYFFWYVRLPFVLSFDHVSNVPRQTIVILGGIVWGIVSAVNATSTALQTTKEKWSRQIRFKLCSTDRLTG
jgi:hypothetical protein